jgi:hypothetical protein
MKFLPPALTLRSWVRIPLKAWMFLCVYSVCVVGSGLATGWSPVKGVLLSVLRLRTWRDIKRFIDVLCSKEVTKGKKEKGVSTGKWCFCTIWDSDRISYPMLYNVSYCQIKSQRRGSPSGQGSIHDRLHSVFLTERNKVTHMNILSRADHNSGKWNTFLWFIR